jgi:hypothetical protein
MKYKRNSMNFTTDIYAELEMNKIEIFSSVPEYLIGDLDAFERIQNSIRILWGTVELKIYLISLLADTRGHTRQGFPPKVASAILKMSLYNLAYLDSKGIKHEEPATDFGYHAERWTIPKGF